MSMARTPEASAALLAEALGISLRTARRFKAAGRMPFAYAVVWAILAEGDLGIADPAFSGWRVRDGQIYSPDGVAFRPGEIAAIPIRHQQLAHLTRQLEQPQQLLLCASA
jgi:hypothetical protein